MPIEKQVFWLEISVDDLLGMEIFECQGDFCSIEFSNWVREPLGIQLVKIFSCIV